MIPFVKHASALIAALSLMSTSTMAVAATPPAPVHSAWSTLAFLNGGQSAAAYCGATAIGAAAAVAAQGAGTSCVLPQLDPVVVQQPVVGEPALPPPLPGAAAGVGGGGLSPLILVLGALAAAAAAYFIINGLDGNNDDNSPA